MRPGWYITSARAGEYDDAEYMLFELTAEAKKDVAVLLKESNRVAEAFGSWGSVCMHHIVNLVVLTGLTDSGLPISDELADDICNGPVFVGESVDINAIPDECVWRSECHAVRAMSAGGVYLRALCKYSSAEAETDDLAPLFSLEEETE